MEALEEQGYLHTDPEHGGVELMVKSENVLFRGEKVEMTVRETTDVEKKYGKKTVVVNDGSNNLFAALKALRLKLAQQENVPAYIIFSNACLADMAAKAPKNMAEFLEVLGVGEVKAARYGRAFLDAISNYES